MEGTLETETNILIQPQARKDDSGTDKPQSEEVMVMKVKDIGTEVEVILLDSSSEESQPGEVNTADIDALIQLQASNNDALEGETIIPKETTSEATKFIKMETAEDESKNHIVETILVESSSDDDNDSLNQSRASDIEVINIEAETVLLDEAIKDEALNELKAKKEMASRSSKRRQDYKKAQRYLQKRKVNSFQKKNLMKAKEKTTIYKNDQETPAEQQNGDNVACYSSQPFNLGSKHETFNIKKVQESMPKSSKKDEDFATPVASRASIVKIGSSRLTSAEKRRFHKALRNGATRNHAFKLAKIPTPDLRQSGSSVSKLGVVSTNANEYPLSRKHLIKIEEAVIDVMIELKKKLFKPKFLGKKFFVEHFQSSWLYFICADDLTVNWMHNNFHKIKAKCDLDVRLVNEKSFPKMTTKTIYKIKGCFPHSSTLSVGKILATISAQNHNIETTKWKVLNKIINGTKIILIMSIDEESKNALVAKKGNIYYRFSEIKLELNEKTEWSDDGIKSLATDLNSNKQRNFSWDSSTSRSYGRTDIKPLVKSSNFDRIIETGSKAVQSDTIIATGFRHGNERFRHGNERPMERSPNRLSYTFGSSVIDTKREYATHPELDQESKKPMLSLSEHYCTQTFNSGTFAFPNSESNNLDFSSRRNDFEHPNRSRMMRLMEPYHNETITSDMPVSANRDYDFDSIIYDSIRGIPTKSESYRPPTFNSHAFKSNPENFTSNTSLPSIFSLSGLTSNNQGASTSRAFSHANTNAMSRSSAFGWMPPPPRWD